MKESIKQTNSEESLPDIKVCCLYIYAHVPCKHKNTTVTQYQAKSSSL